MSDQRVPIWAADADLDDDVELNLLNLVIGNYGQNNFEDGALDQWSSQPILIIHAAPIQQPHLDGPDMTAIQQHVAQQAAFAQIPDVVKAVSFPSTTLDIHIF